MTRHNCANNQISVEIDTLEHKNICFKRELCITQFYCKLTTLQNLIN